MNLASLWSVERLVGVSLPVVLFVKQFVGLFDGESVGGFVRELVEVSLERLDGESGVFVVLVGVSLVYLLVDQMIISRLSLVPNVGEYVGLLLKVHQYNRYSKHQLNHEYIRHVVCKIYHFINIINGSNKMYHHYYDRK